MTNVHEKDIIAILTSLTMPLAVPKVRADHQSRTKTVAYRGGASELNSINFHSKTLNFYGQAIVVKQDFASNTDDNLDDHLNLARKSISAAIVHTKAQAAFALSLHYEYPHDGRTSAHTVGFFHSRGSFGARRAGSRFFDPNSGTWQFKNADGALDFYCDDWLPNFVAGTVTQDPGHPAAKARELAYFRLVQLEPE